MAPEAANPSRANQNRVFAVAAGLFVIWGVALWLYNSLFFKFSQFFALGPVPIAWTLTAFHAAYVCLALPAVLFHRQFGYKLGLLVGLSVFGIGAFLLYLAIIDNSPAWFFAAAMVIGACGAWLDTALNPLAASSGEPDSVIQRMNVAHLFNGAGLFAAYITAVTVLGRDYRLTSGATAPISARPYVLVGLGAILLAFLVEQIALPAFAAKGCKRYDRDSLIGDLRALFADKLFLTGAVALGCYCAVLTILWTANYQYQHSELPGRVVPIFERGWFWLVAGRCAGVALMRWIDPVRLLQIAAGLCLVAIAVAAAAGGLAGWAALLSASFLLGIAFPTIYGAALQGQWTRIAAAAGVLAIMAGCGNALSSLTASLSLDALVLSPRLVILAALPFAAAVLFYARKAGKARSLGRT